MHRHEFDVANMDWEVVKYTEYRDWGGEDPCTNKRYWPTDPRTSLVPTYNSTIYLWYGLVWKGESLLLLPVK